MISPYTKLYKYCSLLETKQKLASFRDVKKTDVYQKRNKNTYKSYLNIFELNTKNII